MAKKISFKEGTTAQRAASEVAEGLKERPRSSGAKAVDNPFALSRYVVKRMSPSQRRKVAARR